VFDQEEFSEPGDSFADEGVVYIPPTCRSEPGGVRPQDHDDHQHEIEGHTGVEADQGSAR
jgi:hypothetical protein